MKRDREMQEGTLTEILIRSGGVVSAVGIGLFIVFASILLIFPVSKSCDPDNTNCVYSSTAPELVRWIIQPAYLAGSLLVIAGGVFLVRFGRWRESKKTGEGV